MRAMVMREHGGPMCCGSRSCPIRPPGPGDVLVRVRACGLNHLDLWTRSGQPGRPLPLPHVLGNDIAGEAVATGAGVEDCRPGPAGDASPGVSCGRCRPCLAGEDNACRRYRILGHQIHGGYAELVRCPVANCVPLPDGFSFEEAAAFPLVFLTAWHMLVTRARLGRGRTCSCGGPEAASAWRPSRSRRLLGGRVIASAGSDAKLEQARQLGADAVVNHYAADVVAEVKGLTGKKGPTWWSSTWARPRGSGRSCPSRMAAGS